MAGDGYPTIDEVNIYVHRLVPRFYGASREARRDLAQEVLLWWIEKGLAILEDPAAWKGLVRRQTLYSIKGAVRGSRKGSDAMDRGASVPLDAPDGRPLPLSSGSLASEDPLVEKESWESRRAAFASLSAKDRAVLLTMQGCLSLKKEFGGNTGTAPTESVQRRQEFSLSAAEVASSLLRREVPSAVFLEMDHWREAAAWIASEMTGHDFTPKAFNTAQSKARGRHIDALAEVDEYWASVRDEGEVKKQRDRVGRAFLKLLDRDEQAALVTWIEYESGAFGANELARTALRRGCAHDDPGSLGRRAWLKLVNGTNVGTLLDEATVRTNIVERWRTHVARNLEITGG